MVLYDKNCSYEIYVVNESLEGNTLLFSITKTIFSDKNCENVTQQYHSYRRLFVDDEGNVYTSRKPNKIWFNWFNH